MSDVIPIDDRYRPVMELIEHRAFVAGVQAAAAAADAQLVLAEPAVARAGRNFSGWLRRNAHRLAEEANR